MIKLDVCKFILGKERNKYSSFCLAVIYYYILNVKNYIYIYI